MQAENSVSVVDLRRAAAEGVVAALLFGVPMGLASSNVWAGLCIGVSVGASIAFSVAAE